MLDWRPMLDHDGVQLGDAICRHPRGRGHATERSAGHGIVFVRRGCFVRSADGREALLDPTVAFCRNPGEEQRFDHPDHRGDDCTAIGLDVGTVASLWGGLGALPSGPLPIGPAVDLQHRLLLVAARRGEDRHELYERVVTLVADTLEAIDPAPVASGRPGTVRARQSLVNGVREALSADPDRSLPQLARELAVSPHHLSRTFRALTGTTVSRHRLLLRVRGAMDRLTAGDRDLARLAAELGFADQSHLNRAVRRQTGHTPAALRRALGPRR